MRRGETVWGGGMSSPMARGGEYRDEHVSVESRRWVGDEGWEWRQNA